MSNRCVCTVDNTFLGELLDSARERVVFVAPGLTKLVAEKLATAWRRLEPAAVSVVLDVDPEVCRLGYGEEDALDVLQRCARELNQTLCEQPGLRIGLLIVDDRTLVYSPTPCLVESDESVPEPMRDEQEEILVTRSTPQRTNAVLLNGTPSELARELGSGLDGESTRIIGLDQMDAKRLDDLHADLKVNPPIRFDLARYERVFNSQLEFVEMEVLGCSVSRHTASIPADLMGLAQDDATRKRLRSSFKVIGETDAADDEGKLSEKSVQQERKRIAEKFLVNLPTFGTVILRSNRAKFEEEVKSLRAMVTDFSLKLKSKLDTIIADNVGKLATALFPAVKARPPERWTRSLGDKPGDKELGAQLEDDLRRAFGSGAALVSEMKVNVLFKGVTYQLLTDPKFITVAKDRFPRLRLLEEFQAAPEVHAR